MGILSGARLPLSFYESIGRLPEGYPFPPHSRVVSSVTNREAEVLRVIQSTPPGHHILLVDLGETTELWDDREVRVPGAPPPAAPAPSPRTPAMDESHSDWREALRDLALPAWAAALRESVAAPPRPADPDWRTAVMAMDLSPVSEAAPAWPAVTGRKPEDTPRESMSIEDAYSLARKVAGGSASSVADMRDALSTLFAVKNGAKPGDGQYAAADQAVQSLEQAIKKTARESADATGKLWDICIIEAGMSKNGREYPASTLEKAVPLFEDLNVYLHKFDPELANHLPEQVRTAFPYGVAGNLVGWLENVRWDPQYQSEKQKAEGIKGALVGDCVLVDDRLRETFMNLWEQDRLDKLGFSIDVEGTVSEGTPIKGIPTMRVETIESAYALDVVTYPAAGGRMRRPKAGQSPTGEEKT